MITGKGKSAGNKEEYKKRAIRCASIFFNTWVNLLCASTIAFGSGSAAFVSGGVDALVDSELAFSSSKHADKAERADASETKSVPFQVESSAQGRQADMMSLPGFELISNGSLLYGAESSCAGCTPTGIVQISAGTADINISMPPVADGRPGIQPTRLAFVEALDAEDMFEIGSGIGEIVNTQDLVDVAVPSESPTRDIKNNLQQNDNLLE